MADTSVEWRKYVDGLDLSSINDSDRAALENDIRKNLDSNPRYKREYFRKRAKEISKGADLTEKQAKKYPEIAPNYNNPFTRGSKTAEQYEIGVMLRNKASNLRKLSEIYSEVAKKLPRK